MDTDKCNNSMMNWDRLISDKRFGLEEYHDPSQSRSDFQRDFDRMVFSSPFRRLQNKTQVFPLPGSIFVHNRLTHSLEVSSVGKSMANQVSDKLTKKYHSEPWVRKLNDLGDIVAAACLCHDLGNPPFGHYGEKAISTFFSEGEGISLKEHLSDTQWSNLINFEGNANSFRLLTHQFKGRRPGGFAMTYTTLASIIKYPYTSAHAGTKGKFGFFTSEWDHYIKIADELGIISLSDDRSTFARHPLVYLVEAADDICYQVMDIEDAHKLKILSTSEVMDLLTSFFDTEKQAHVNEVMQRVDDPNEKVAYLRSKVIGQLVNACAQIFVDNEDLILSGKMSGSLIDNLPQPLHSGYRKCSQTAWAKIYRAQDVVDIELAGNQIITYLMHRLLDAVMHPDKNSSKLLLYKVPFQYDTEAPTLYGKVQSVLDHISAMTDVYALDLFRKLNGLSLPAV